MVTINDNIQNSQTKKNNPLGIISVVLAVLAISVLILGMITLLIPFLGAILMMISYGIAVFFNCAGIIIGIVGIIMKGRRKVLAIVGLCINGIMALGMIIYVVITILVATLSSYGSIIMNYMAH